MIQRRSMLVLVIATLVFWSCTSSVDGEDKNQPAATPAVEQPATAGGTDDVSTGVGRKGEGLVGEGSHELDTVVSLMRENLLVLGYTSNIIDCTANELRALLAENEYVMLTTVRPQGLSLVPAWQPALDQADVACE